MLWGLNSFCSYAMHVSSKQFPEPQRDYILIDQVNGILVRHPVNPAFLALHRHQQCIITYSTHLKMQVLPPHPRFLLDQFWSGAQGSVFLTNTQVISAEYLRTTLWKYCAKVLTLHCTALLGIVRDYFAEAMTILRNASDVKAVTTRTDKNQIICDLRNKILGSMMGMITILLGTKKKIWVRWQI